MNSENIPGEIIFTEHDYTSTAKETKRFIDKNKKKKSRSKENIESISFGVPGYPCEPDHFVANEEILYINEQCIIFIFETRTFDQTFDNTFQ